jgi:predicted ATP-binding protein involved in virulence/polyhydroxyalkanoate synthesis regulator phasin
LELVYLWVEKYKNIKKKGFNFSPRFRCDYNEDTNELTIDENDDYIDGFFGDNINVTAIVGKNGSGKSAILEILFYKTKHRNKNKKTFFITLLGNKYYLYLFKSSELVLKKESDIDFSINIELANEVNGKQENITKYDYLSIFYSNLHRKMPFSYNNKEKSFIDTSTSHLTQKNSTQSSSIKNTLTMLNNADIHLPIKLPNDLRISLDCKYFKDKDNSISQKFEELRPTLDDSSNTYFYNILITELVYRYYKKMEITKDEINEIDSFQKLYELFRNKSNIFPDKLYEITSIIKDLPVENNLTIKLSIKSDIKSINEIVDIINSPESLSHLGFDVFRFNFDTQMSTGEDALLFQFANIYDSLTNTTGLMKTYSGDDIVLLIDEGETTLHPQWQKEYLSYLILFLSKNFSEKEFHLVLTSHSPFLLSDIPKQNIIFLDKDEEGNCKVVDGLNDKKQTFGANIHTLLSDSFFMEDGLMGEFAKSKIDRVIKILNQEKPSKEDLGYCEKIIPIIGEPIVKNQLQKMLDSKKLPKVGEIDKIHKEIEALQNRLKDLEVKDDKK